MKMRVEIAVDRKEIRKVGLCVCEVCEKLLNCEDAMERYENGCENFELYLPLCNIDCADCHMFVLGLCGGDLDD